VGAPHGALAAALAFVLTLRITAELRGPDLVKRVLMPRRRGRCLHLAPGRHHHGILTIAGLLSGQGGTQAAVESIRDIRGSPRRNPESTHPERARTGRDRS
jgi:hypothetical protein